MILIAKIDIANHITLSLRNVFLSIAMILCVIGLVDMVWRQGAEVKVILGAIFRILVVAICIWQYPEFIQTGREALGGFREQVFQESGETEFHKVLMAEIKIQPGAMDFVGQICSALLYAIQGFGRLMLSILMFLQSFCLESLMIVSPLLLGFLAWDLTRPMGVQFCFTTLGILLWEVGVLIIDILLIELGNQFLQPTLAAGIGTAAVATGVITSVVSWPLFLNAIVIAALLPAFLYLSVPFIIAAILRGCDPTGPLLLKAMQTASMAFGGIGTMLPKSVGGVGGGTSLFGRLRGGNGGSSGVTATMGGGDALANESGGNNSPGALENKGDISSMENKGFSQPLTPLSSEKSGGGVYSASPLSSSTGSSPDFSSNISSPLSEEKNRPMDSPISSAPHISSQVDISPSKKEKDKEERSANVGEMYVGKHGHVFQQLTPTEFSCRNPHTGYTSMHGGNMHMNNAANRSLFAHNADRATAGDLIRYSSHKKSRES